MKPLACPACGSACSATAGKRFALYPAGCLSVLGLPFAMFHQAQMPLEYRCPGCGTAFKRRSGLAKFNLVMLIPIAGVTALYWLGKLISLILGASP